MISKTKYFSIVTLIFAVLLCISVWKDCERLIRSAKYELQTIDSEILNQELRYIENLKSLVTDSEFETSAEYKAYSSALSLAERHAAFSSLKNKFGNITGDVNNPINRRYIDEMNGALNRISRVQVSLEEANKEFSKICSSWQGRLVACRG